MTTGLAIKAEHANSMAALPGFEAQPPAGGQQVEFRDPERTQRRRECDGSRKWAGTAGG